MLLPEDKILPTHNLSSVFNDTTNSYKYFWLLAIIDILKNRPNIEIEVEEIVIEMIAKVWYPINYFNLSFGKQDKFAIIIGKLKGRLVISEKTSKEDLVNSLTEMKKDEIVRKLINDFMRYVPFRFLTPWFSRELRSEKDTRKNLLLFKLSERFFMDKNVKPLYRFSHNKAIISFDSDWFEYFSNNLKIIEGFTLWNLSLYLKKHNPNVPNIQGKLFAPIKRELDIAKKFWYEYLSGNIGATCIYSSNQLNLDNITIDHFLPWKFVAHDLLWNLIPTTKSINSAKGDCIPSEIYLTNFSTLQHNAIKFALENDSVTQKHLEDYSIFFKSTIRELNNISLNVFQEKIFNNFKPLMQIALNMGFTGNWTYNK